MYFCDFGDLDYCILTRVNYLNLHQKSSLFALDVDIFRIPRLLRCPAAFTQFQHRFSGVIRDNEIRGQQRTRYEPNGFFSTRNSRDLPGFKILLSLLRHRPTPFPVGSLILI